MPSRRPRPDARQKATATQSTSGQQGSSRSQASTTANCKRGRAPAQGPPSLHSKRLLRARHPPRRGWCWGLTPAAGRLPVQRRASRRRDAAAPSPAAPAARRACQRAGRRCTTPHCLPGRWERWRPAESLPAQTRLAPWAPGQSGSAPATAGAGAATEPGRRPRPTGPPRRRRRRWALLREPPPRRPPPLGARRCAPPRLRLPTARFRHPQTALTARHSCVRHRRPQPQQGAPG